MPEYHTPENELDKLRSHLADFVTNNQSASRANLFIGKVWLDEKQQRIYFGAEPLYAYLRQHLKRDGITYSALHAIDLCTIIYFELHGGMMEVSHGKKSGIFWFMRIPDEEDWEEPEEVEWAEFLH